MQTKVLGPDPLNRETAQEIEELPPFSLVLRGKHKPKHSDVNGL